MRYVLTLGFAMLSSACSSEDGDGSTAEKKETVSFHFETDIDSGDEIEKCQFVGMPADRGELSIGSMFHEYSAGSHHFLVYRTELTEMPAGGEALVDCKESGWMSQVRGVVYAAQETKGRFEVPKGVAQTFAPGEVLLVQTHYLNSKSTPIHAVIDFDMELVDPAEVSTEAGVLFFYNPSIVLPPAQKSFAELSCPLPEDATIAFATSHMHKWGVKFRAESTDAATAGALGPLYETTEWSEPTPRVFSLDPPAVLPKGSSIRYRCDYDNPDPSTVVQGLSAATNEMCMFVGLYWPRQERAVDFCFDGSVTTQGTKSALDSLKCMVACGGNKNAECMGQCWSAACPKAPTALMGITRCLGDDCSPACYIDPTGSECASCAKAKCPSEYERFVGASCQ